MPCIHDVSMLVKCPACTAAREAERAQQTDAIEALKKLLPGLRHQDEQYVNDHWATGNCPRCIAEIALGLRNPEAGGRSLEENRALIASRSET